MLISYIFNKYKKVCHFLIVLTKNKAIFLEINYYFIKLIALFSVLYTVFSFSQSRIPAPMSLIVPCS